ncbi:hypothetical protein [Kaistia sp. MMO-174]|uniref:hypothetical protein n=1 Tax=Kaistia sp. MMO-174 TaxID=3081256 RepID=UPI0030169B5B
MTREIAAVQADIEADFVAAYNEHQRELHAAVVEHKAGDPKEIIVAVASVAIQVAWAVMKTQLKTGMRLDHAGIVFRQIIEQVATAIVETELTGDETASN